MNYENKQILIYITYIYLYQQSDYLPTKTFENKLKSLPKSISNKACNYEIFFLKKSSGLRLCISCTT